VPLTHLPVVSWLPRMDHFLAVPVSDSVLHSQVGNMFRSWWPRGQVQGLDSHTPPTGLSSLIELDCPPGSWSEPVAPSRDVWRREGG